MTDSVESQIQQVWATEQEILDVIHKVCTENGLRYSLAYGTLIGAVRHKGFIPWDDDIDVGLKRDEWYQLREILQKNLWVSLHTSMMNWTPHFRGCLEKYSMTGNRASICF